MLPIDPSTTALGLPLWTWAAKATVLVLVAGALTSLVGRQSAALRHVVWTAALAALLLAPVAGGLPSWSLPWMRTAPPSLQTDLPSSDPPARSRVAATTAQERKQPAVIPAAASAAPQQLGATASSPIVVRPAWTWPQRIAAVWLLSAGVQIGIWARRIAQIHQLCRTARPFHGQSAQSALQQARDALGVRRPIELLLADSLLAPAVWGVRRVSILAPVAAQHWTAERWRTVLLHELAHVRRGDVIWQTLADLSRRLWWWHPAVWIAAWQQRRCQESACDDLVLAVGVRPSEYASELFALASGLDPSQWLSAGVPLVGRSELGRRVRAILSPRGHNLSSPTRRAITAVAMSLAGLAVWTATEQRPAAATQSLAPEAAADPEVLQTLPPAADRPEQGMIDRLNTAEILVKREIDRLRSEGRETDAEALQKRLQELLARRAPDSSPTAHDRPELHIVGLGRGRMLNLDTSHATLRLSYRTAPVVLCLSSPIRVNWELQVDPGVRLQEIVLTGAAQQVEGQPAGTKVTDRSEGGDASLVDTLRITQDDQVLRWSLAETEAKLGLPASSAFWVRQASREPILVGPENRAWREASAAALADALVTDVARADRIRAWRTLRAVNFVALDTVKSFGTASPSRLRAFTLAGPSSQLLTEFDERLGNVRQAIWDGNAAFVLLEGANVARVDSASGNAARLNLEPYAGELQHASCLALDTRRRTLFFSTLDSLLRFDLTRNAWLTPTGLNLPNLKAMAYLPSADCLFGLQVEPNEVALCRIDLGGVVIDRLRLPDIPAANWSEAWQLSTAGELLILLRQHATSDGSPDPRDAFLVDPGTGQVQFTSRLSTR